MNDTNKPPALEGLLTLEEAAAWVSFYEEEALSPRAALHRLRSVDNHAIPESVLVAMPAGTVLSEPPIFEPGDPLPRPCMYLVGGGMLAGFLEDLEVHGEAVPPMLVAHVGTRRWKTDTPVLMSALRLTPSQVKSLSPWSALSRAVLRGEVDVEDEPSASITAENPAQPAPASEQAQELPDAPRRLAALRALGGDVKWQRGEWRITQIEALEAQERKQGRVRTSQKTIRADLKEAAEAERKAKREGPTPAPWHP